MKYVEWYKCCNCEEVWKHEWDTEDYSNDFTQCPKCDSFSFDEIESAMKEIRTDRVRVRKTFQKNSTKERMQ